MKISDFLIDLNDLWGRLIPGLIIILDLYLLTKQLHTFDVTKILDFFSQNAFLTTMLFFGLLIYAHILGELSLYIIFRVRRFLPRPTPRENVQELEVTRNNDIKKFFQEHFAKSALDSTSKHVFNYCKEYLLQASPETYFQALKIEARINLKGGIIFPLVGLSVLLILAQLWLISLTSLALLIVFADGFRTSSRKEHQFVYRAYYSYHQLHYVISQRPITSRSSG